MAGLAACDSSSDNFVSPTPLFSQSDSAAFAVSDTLVVVAANFAGEMVFKSAPVDTVCITYAKWVTDTTKFGLIDIIVHAQPDSIDIASTNSGAPNNSNVDFDIVVPPDVRVDCSLAAGTIDCTANLRDSCSFVLAAGNIVLSLPASLAATVDLATGAGTVACDFTVVGTVTSQSIVGTIGSGQNVHIYARVAAGSIQLRRQP